MKNNIWKIWYYAAKESTCSNQKLPSIASIKTSFRKIRRTKNAFYQDLSSYLSATGLSTKISKAFQLLSGYMNCPIQSPRFNKPNNVSLYNIDTFHK